MVRRRSIAETTLLKLRAPGGTEYLHPNESSFQNNVHRIQSLMQRQHYEVARQILRLAPFYHTLPISAGDVLTHSASASHLAMLTSDLEN